MNARDENWFFKTAAVTLILTALAKLYSSTGAAKVLMVQDQLLHLGYRPLLIAVAVIEIAVALFLLKSRHETRRALALLWLSGNFLFYHFGNTLIGVRLCPCLGRLTDRLPLPPGLADVLLQFLVIFWFLVSLNCVWRRGGFGEWSRLFTSSSKFFPRGLPGREELDEG